MLLSVNIALRFSKSLSFLQPVPAGSFAPSKAASQATSKNKSFMSAWHLNPAVQLISKYKLWRLIQLPLSDFVDSSFMELAVAFPCRLLHINSI
jgi:hypothetical protein